MEALQGQLQHLQAAFSQYRKGMFLNLTLDPSLGLGTGGVGVELTGPEA